MEFDSSGNNVHGRNQGVYEYKRIPLMKKFKKYYRKMDFFANPITLKYKGERRFYTNFGALTSLVIILVMVALSFYQFSIMISYSQITFQGNSQLAAPTDQILGFDNGFMFAYRIIHKDSQLVFNTTSYFHVDINEVTQTWQPGNEVRDWSQKPIMMQNCTKALFKSNMDITVQMIDRLSLSSYICPQNKTYKVKGDFIDDQFIYVKLGISKCNAVTAQKEGYRCKSDNEIAEAMSKLEVQFIYLNANFDQLDLKDPIKNFIDDRLRASMLPGYYNKFDVFLMNNTATLYNDYLRIQGPNNIQFYQVKQMEHYTDTYDAQQRNVMSFYLRASREQLVFDRKVYSVYDIFAQIGGIRNSLMFIGLIFCAAFEYNLFLSSLIRKLFHFPARFDAERKDTEPKRKKSKDKKGRRKSMSGSAVTDNFHAQALMDEQNDDQRNQQLGVSELKDEINLVIGRKNAADFNLKTAGLLKGFFCCLICKKSRRLRESPSKRQALFFQKGEDRLNKELDISNVVKNIRKVNYLMKILLDKDQRRLLKLKQSEFVSSSSEEHDPNYFKKGVKKDKLVNLYVDNLRTKKLKLTDVKLLEIMGFKKVLDILNKQRSLDKVQSDWVHEDHRVQESLPTLEHSAKPTLQTYETNNQPVPQIQIKTSNFIRAPYMTDKRNDVLQGKFNQRRSREKDKFNEAPYRSFDKSQDSVRKRHKDSGGDKLMEDSSSPETTLSKIHLQFTQTTTKATPNQYSINKTEPRQYSMSPTKYTEANNEQTDTLSPSNSSPKTRQPVRQAQANLKSYSKRNFLSDNNTTGRGLMGSGDVEDMLKSNVEQVDYEQQKDLKSDRKKHHSNRKRYQ